MKPVLQQGKGQRVITSELKCKHIKRHFKPFSLFYFQERKYFTYSSGNVFDCLDFLACIQEGNIQKVSSVIIPVGNEIGSECFRNC